MRNPMITMNSSMIIDQLHADLPKYYHKFRDIQQFLFRLTLPYIFFVGSVGLITNTFTALLLSTSYASKNLKHKWTLIALALSDLLLNISLLIRVVQDLLGGQIHLICLIISFLSHLAELLSALLTVLFTIQRYAAVRHPLQAAIERRSSPFASILIIVLFSLFFCLILSYVNNSNDCHEELPLSWFIADAFSSFVIPFSLILIFNILIIHLIRTHARSPLSAPIIFKHRFQRRQIPFDSNDRPSDSRLESYSMTCSAVGQRTSRYNLVDDDTNEKQQAKSSLLINEDRESTGRTNPLTPVSSDAADSINNDNTSRSTNFISNKYFQTAQSIRVTRMLILVSTCFLILNAPAHLFLIAMKIYTRIDSNIFHHHVELEHFQQSRNLTEHQLKHFVYIEMKNESFQSKIKNGTIYTEYIDDSIAVHLLYIGVSITQLISYASYSLNFFLYSLSGIAFRSSLRQLLSKITWN